LFWGLLWKFMWGFEALGISWAMAIPWGFLEIYGEVRFNILGGSLRFHFWFVGSGVTPGGLTRSLAKRHSRAQPKIFVPTEKTRKKKKKKKKQKKKKRKKGRTNIPPQCKRREDFEQPFIKERKEKKEKRKKTKKLTSRRSKKKKPS